MKLRSAIVASFLAFASLVACSSNTATPGGGGGGNGGACTLSSNGTVTSCYSWTNLTADQSSTLCPTSNNTAQATYALVSSCPSANQVGTCTTTVSVNGTSYTDSETFYSANGDTCANAKSACSSGSVSGSGITTSFSGNGC
jgi:hypothetical protein